MRAKRPKNENRRRPFSVKHTLVGVVAAVLIFGFGVGVGNGSITFGINNGYGQSRNTDLPARLDYSSVDQIYDSLRKNYDGELTVEELLDGLKKGLVSAAGDSYTEYLDPEAAKDFDEELNGTFSGIGAELGKEEQSIIIMAPIAGFPAEKAGLRARDVIVEIDGERAYDISISEAVNKIRGPEGTKVKLRVIRNDSEDLTFEITRQKITIPSVTSEILDGNIGHLKVSRFGDDTARLSREAANKFRQAGVRGVILDMRNNPGGLLEASVDLAEIWLERGDTILQEKRDGVVIKTYTAGGNPILRGVPTVVLINEGSASASEITAGALKDNDAATIIGTKSFGKGSVQSLVRFRDNSVLKVTIARWFTPSGQNIDKEGVEPDQTVELTDEDYQNNRDPQKDAALRHLRR